MHSRRAEFEKKNLQEGREKVLAKYHSLKQNTSTYEHKPVTFISEQAPHQ